MGISIDQPDKGFFIDINEYLIANFPMLNWKARNAVGTLCEQDLEFDLTAIYEQIDQWVLIYAESKGIEVPIKETELDESETT
jgi:hypothetical protein